LQKHGLDATLITDRDPGAYRDIRLINTVAHHHVTIARETYLGVNHRSDPKEHYYYHDHFFNFPGQPFSFRGDFSKASRAVDYRIFDGGFSSSRRQDRVSPDRGQRHRTVGRAFRSARGGNRKRPARPAVQVPAGFAATAPSLRRALYGVRQPDPMNVTLSVSPGHGETIVIPTNTFDGVANALLSPLTRHARKSFQITSLWAARARGVNLLLESKRRSMRLHQNRDRLCRRRLAFQIMVRKRQ
jgi:hypothetical protein